MSRLFSGNAGWYKAWLTLQKLIEETGPEHLPCAQSPDLYHPNAEEKYYANLAKKACEGCPIKIPCGIYAIKHEKEGIWGGMTANERTNIRRHGVKVRIK